MTLTKGWEKNLMNKLNLWESYGVWLIRRVNFSKRNYSSLMKKLHNTPFKWVIERDENRASDGLCYREFFFHSLDSEKIYRQFNEEMYPCSVLEMLVALAIRVDDEYIGDPSNPHPENIFWEMCCNLGLENMKNDENFEAEFLKKINKFLEKDYDFNGKGGIFPVKHPKKDHRKIEIWSEMMEYLSENY